jgi:hypothetical protein
MRYWAMSVAVALAGGCLAIGRFAFAPNHAVWIAFGVAIAAGVFSLAATGVALVRQNQAFSGLSAVSALVASWTIIATRVFTTSSALWLAFAGGLALLLLSLRALALHETTIERVVHALELNGASQPAAVSQGQAVATSPAHRLRRGLQISSEIRSWMYWLTHTGVGLAGAFVVLATFAWWPKASPQVSPRWLTFALGVAGASLAISLLLERVLAARSEGRTASQRAAIAITTASAAVSIALIVLMAVLHGTDARWWAFGLGDGMVGVSLLAWIIHELGSERVRHELEIAHATTTIQAEAADAR